MHDLVCKGNKINIQICANFVIDKLENDLNLFFKKSKEQIKLNFFIQDQLHLEIRMHSSQRHEITMATRH